MKITKNIVSKETVKTLSPDYVKFVEGDYGTAFSVVMYKFEKLKKGQKVITYTDGKFVQGKISSINHNDIRAIDGPVVRFTNGEYSWRVDGNYYAFPIER